MSQNHKIQPLFIRTDAGGAIGTGHVMRMIALAQGWVDRCSLDAETNCEFIYRRTEVVFICAKLPAALEIRLREEGFAVVRIDAEPGSEEDLRQTLAVLTKQMVRDRDQETSDRRQGAAVDENQSSYPISSQKDASAQSNGTNLKSIGRTSHILRSEYSKIQPWLILDGYNFDYDYQKGIRQNADLSLLCLDDHGYSERWYCDAILNHNLDAEKRIDYQKELPGTKLLMGAPYCLLRREFLQAQRPSKAWGCIKSLLVTLGGSDPDNATGAVLQLLNQSCARSLDIRVLLGSDNPHTKAIQAFASHHRIEILYGVSNMTDHYHWADGIISAGGSTCWEWLFFGLPGAIVTIAENQLTVAEALSKTRRAALSLGWFNDLNCRTDSYLLTEFLNHPETQIDHTEAESLVDGYGLARVACFLFGRKLTVRKAQYQDCELYFKWANDLDVRKNSFTPEPIPMEKHRKWFESRLENPNSCLLMGVDFDGNRVGQIRFDYEEGRQAWTIDISTGKQYRGKGIGKQLLLEGLIWMRVCFGQHLPTEADVLNSNKASMNLFQSAGLRKVRTGKNFTTFGRAI